MLSGSVVVAGDTAAQERLEAVKDKGRATQPASAGPFPRSTFASPRAIHRVIQRERGFKAVDLGELWQYRGLIWQLAARDLKTRYRQSLMGIAWSLMQPLFTLAVFVVFFNFLGHTPTTSGVPYVVSLLCGIVLWNFFATVLTSTANSLPDNVHLITKVYCPRLVFPLSTVIVGLVDLAISLVVLVALLVSYRIPPGVQLVLLPVFAAMATFVALTVGLWMAALSVRWRDIRFMITALLQVGFFASPVVYETSAMVPPRLRIFYNLNPMAGVLDGFRWSLVGSTGFHWATLVISGPTTLVFLVLALYLFRRVERTLPDYL